MLDQTVNSTDSQSILAELNTKSIAELKAGWVDLEIQRSQIVQMQSILIQLWQEKEKNENVNSSVAQQTVDDFVEEVASEVSVKPVSKSKRTKSK